MSIGFSGEPLTRWDGTRNMILEKDFYFIDSKGEQWNAKKGSCLNGATIPKALWSVIGAPYVGKYRRASVVHDVAVGELCNPDVSYAERKKADRMFYEACRFDGCNKRFAALLYIGVRFGTWSSLFTSPFDKSNNFEDILIKKDNPEDEYIRSKFWNIVDSTEDAILSEDLETIDLLIENEIANN